MGCVMKTFNYSELNQAKDFINLYIRDYSPLSFYLLRDCFGALSFEVKLGIILYVQQEKISGINYVLDRNPNRFRNELIENCSQIAIDSGKKKLKRRSKRPANSSVDKYWISVEGKIPIDVNSLISKSDSDHLLRQFIGGWTRPLPSPVEFWGLSQVERLKAVDQASLDDGLEEIIKFADKVLTGGESVGGLVVAINESVSISFEDLEEVLAQFYYGGPCLSVRREIQWVLKGDYWPNFDDCWNGEQEYAKNIQSMWRLLNGLTEKTSKILARYLPSLDLFVEHPDSEFIFGLPAGCLENLLNRNDVFLREFRDEVLKKHSLDDSIHLSAMRPDWFKFSDDLIRSIVGENSESDACLIDRRRKFVRHVMAFSPNITIPQILALKDWIQRVSVGLVDVPPDSADSAEWEWDFLVKSKVYDAEYRRIKLLTEDTDRSSLAMELHLSQLFIFARDISIGKIFNNADGSDIDEYFLKRVVPGNPWATYSKFLHDYSERLFSLEFSLDAASARDIERYVEGFRLKLPDFALRRNEQCDKLLSDKDKIVLSPVADDLRDAGRDDLNQKILEQLNSLNTKIQSLDSTVDYARSEMSRAKNELTEAVLVKYRGIFLILALIIILMIIF